MSDRASRAVAVLVALLAIVLVTAAAAFGGATDSLGRAALTLGVTGLWALAVVAIRPSPHLALPRGPSRAQALVLSMAGFALLCALPWPVALARVLAPYATASREAGLGTSGGVAPSLDAGATWTAALLLAGLVFLSAAAGSAVAVTGPLPLLRLLTVAGGLVACVALGRGRYLQGEDLMFGLRVDNPLNAYGTFPSRGQFAGFLVVLLGAAVGLGVASHRVLDRLAAGLALGVGTAAVFASGARAGMVGVAVLAGTAIVFGAPRGARRRRLILFAIPVLAVVALRASGWEPLVRAIPVRGDEPKRLEIWQGSLGLAVEQPMTGIGLHAFRWAYAGEGREPADTFVAIAENDGLQWLAEMGIVGLLLGGLFVAAVARSFARSRREGQAPAVPSAVALSGFAGLVPLAMTGAPLHTPAVAAAAVLAWAAAAGLVRGDDGGQGGGYRVRSKSEAPWHAS